MRRLCLASALVFMSVLAGCRASSPSKVERSVMGWTKHTVSVRNRSERNPLPPTANNIGSGKEAFSHYCVACHGMDGQNTGVPFAESMSPPVPSLNSSEVQSYTDGQLKWVIDNGIEPSGMPASKGILSDDEIWSMVLFIRHLPPAGSLGDPPMYSK
ncbi:MAG: cytochrome c class [Edaphobacter sp.]|jgi:mono/diheme cytochrome c family protein|nr:cytochrome c class [Edaphobacter sp.]